MRILNFVTIVVTIAVFILLVLLLFVDVSSFSDAQVNTIFVAYLVSIFLLALNALLKGIFRLFLIFTLWIFPLIEFICLILNGEKGVLVLSNIDPGEMIIILFVLPGLTYFFSWWRRLEKGNDFLSKERENFENKERIGLN